ncbi:Uncharacterised protein [Vibrio cholerae]|nr:Uncharacterised protein [Vibrio cholerae]
METAAPILIGNINTKEEKLSATWCAATTVDPNGATKSATTAKRVTSKKRAAATGKPKRNRRINSFGCGLWKVSNTFTCARRLEVTM